MTHIARLWCVMVVLASVCAGPCVHAWAQASVDPDALAHGDPTMAPDESDRLFLGFLKEAVTNDRRDWIADQIDYPIKAAVGGQRIAIETKDAFLAHYDEIVNERVRRSILTQRFEELFSNWQGVMIDRGQVWFDGIFEADGCDHLAPVSSDRRVFACSFDRTYRVMIKAINNDVDPETGPSDGPK